MVQPLKRSNMSLTFDNCFLVGGPGSLRHGDEEGKAWQAICCQVRFVEVKQNNCFGALRLEFMYYLKKSRRETTQMTKFKEEKN